MNYASYLLLYAADDVALATGTCDGVSVRASKRAPHSYADDAALVRSDADATGVFRARPDGAAHLGLDRVGVRARRAHRRAVEALETGALLGSDGALAVELRAAREVGLARGAAPGG